jgi:hypothetical protein
LLRERFGPSPASVPIIDVKLVALNAYDELAERISRTVCGGEMEPST